MQALNYIAPRTIECPDYFPAENLDTLAAIRDMFNERNALRVARGQYRMGRLTIACGLAATNERIAKLDRWIGEQVRALTTVDAVDACTPLDAEEIAAIFAQIA